MPNTQTPKIMTIKRELLLIGLSAICWSAFSVASMAQFAYGLPSSGTKGLFDGYAVSAQGNLTPLAGSPFGKGSESEWVMNPLLADPKGNYFYVYYAPDSPFKPDATIFSYKVDKAGTPVSVGKPLQYTAQGGAVFANFAMVSPNGKIVYVANTMSDSEFAYGSALSVLRVQKDGSVSFNPKETYSFGEGQIMSMVSNPSGTLLVAVEDGFDTSDYLVGGRVAPDGSVQFFTIPISDTAEPVGAVFGPGGKYLYHFYYDGAYKVQVFEVGKHDTLGEIPGSPFGTPIKSNATFAFQFVSTPGGKFAYVVGPSGDANLAIYGFSFEANGHITSVPGSPFALSNQQGSDLKMDPKGRFVILTGHSENTGLPGIGAVYYIQSDGSLKTASNSPSPSIPDVECFVGK